MNVRKMRQIGKDILAEHRRFNMDAWMMKLFDATVTSRRERRSAASNMGHSSSNYPPCGTTACFAGSWAIRYRAVDPRAENPFRKLYENGSVGNRCREDLGLPNDDLFFDVRWPAKARRRLARMKPGTSSYARFFVEEVLEDYIETDGWQRPSRRFA